MKLPVSLFQLNFGGVTMPKLYPLNFAQAGIHGQPSVDDLWFGRWYSCHRCGPRPAALLFYLAQRGVSPWSNHPFAFISAKQTSRDQR